MFRCFEVAKALVKEIIQRFGIPKRAYNINGTHFVNQIIQNVTKTLSMKLKNHFASHPQQDWWRETMGLLKLNSKGNGRNKNKPGMLPPSGVTKHADKKVLVHLQGRLYHFPLLGESKTRVSYLFLTLSYRFSQQKRLFLLMSYHRKKSRRTLR